ncbi:TerD family protein [Streptacidiphilus sp. ASG 303]|uniref:TerD family protein n=1 Tax=Streptacidiphilus sp. ASG 303 TaxID=2896847 RepID=UPI001E4BF064|nr:TerD family protein [Streptacidiphilus sp. ASG 303]MCD0482608.1 TerD family protein [Streptacidiphilus sp. ASG 303]
MTQVMVKGSNIPLSAAAVRAVLRWGAASGAPDVDASALLLGADGSVRSDEDFVFYNQPHHPSGLVRHRAKQRVGDAVADTVEVDLAQLPADVDRVVLAGSAEEGPFGAVPDLQVLLYDAAAPEDGEPLARFDIADAGEETALLCAELYRRGDGWKFRAIGQGYASGLAGLATDFGIAVEEDGPVPAGAAEGAPAQAATAPAPPGPAPAPPSEREDPAARPQQRAAAASPDGPSAPAWEPPRPDPATAYPPPPPRAPSAPPQQPLQPLQPQALQPQPQPSQPDPAVFTLPPQGPQFQPR